MSSPKYNRTFHMPWSPGGTNDDKRAASVNSLIGKPIILTEKIDGSNTSLECDGCFARTHAGPPTHKSFDQLKVLSAQIKSMNILPAGQQYFGEWCYALHSIAYSELPSYFLLFGIRDFYISADTKWYSWDFVETQAKAFKAIGIDINTVPVLFKGTVSSEKELKDLVESLMEQPSCCGGIREGVVARIAGEFLDKDFSSCVMKCVRKNHVNPDNDHWLHKDIVKNFLCKK